MKLIALLLLIASGVLGLIEWPNKIGLAVLLTDIAIAIFIYS